MGGKGYNCDADDRVEKLISKSNDSINGLLNVPNTVMELIVYELSVYRL